MTWLQLAVRAIEQGYVGLVRVGRRCSEFILDTIRDGSFVHARFLVLLVVVDRMHIGHGAEVEAGGGHCGADAEGKKGAERFFQDAKVGEENKLDVRTTAISC